jgi:hypothetical protein
MMKLNSDYIKCYFSIGIILVLLSCDRDNNHPGYTYYPDMVDSRAYESFSKNPNFEDKTSMRDPVEGSVPRGYLPLPYTKDLEDRFKAGEDLVNPLNGSV